MTLYDLIKFQPKIVYATVIREAGQKLTSLAQQAGVSFSALALQRLVAVAVLTAW